MEQDICCRMMTTFCSLSPALVTRSFKNFQGKGFAFLEAVAWGAGVLATNLLALIFCWELSQQILLGC